MGGIFTKLYEYLFNKKLEICLIGLENTGKTTFVNVLMGVHLTNYAILFLPQVKSHTINLLLINYSYITSINHKNNNIAHFGIIYPILSILKLTTDIPYFHR